MLIVFLRPLLPLRIGDLQFLDGDPDRLVLVGRLHRAEILRLVAQERDALALEIV